MKRSGPPKRKTPLKRGSGPKADPTKARAWQQRSKPLNKVSEKTKARNQELKKATDKYLKDNPECELKASPNCAGTAGEVHHIKARSVRPDLVCEPSNFAATCRLCHDEVENNAGWFDGKRKKRAWED